MKNVKPRGDFFAIERAAYDAVCDLNDIVAAEAYLVIASGSDGSNRLSTWSAKAVATHTGHHRKTAAKAIDRLLEQRFLRKYGKPSRPSYELISQLERATASPTQSVVLDKIRQDEPLDSQERRLLAQLIEKGLLDRDSDGNLTIVSQPLEEPVWLPNALVTGVSGETPPIQRLGRTREVNALRLLVHLYSLHDLLEHGGIDPERLSQTYSRTRLRQVGREVLWRFDQTGAHRRLTQALTAWTDAYQRDAPQYECPCQYLWRLLDLIERLGLIVWMVEVRDSDAVDARTLFSIPPLETNAGAALYAELKLGEALYQRARTLIGVITGLSVEEIEPLLETDFAGLVLPISADIPQVAARGVARLRYRPRTDLVAVGIAALSARANTALAEFAHDDPPDEILF